MLNKEELQAFLNLLLVFAETNRLSALMCSKLFGISHSSMSRWMSLARQPDALTHSVYKWLSNPIADKINRLNKINEDRGMYEAIATQKPAERIELMQRILDGKLVW